MIDLSDHIEDIARQLEAEGKLGERTKGPQRRDEWRYGSHGSLSIVIAGPGRGDWFDHEVQQGGGPRELIQIKGGYDARGLNDWLRHKIGIDPDDNDPILKTYDYTDEHGGLLFQVVRKAGHKFLQRRPDGAGGWIWKRGDRLVLYRLPELIAQKATGNGHPWRVCICEGEKDADRVRRDWGVTATTCPGGAGKWHDDYDRFFSGADVIILVDNDAAGRAHAAQVAAHLAKIATIVRIVELGGHEKADISDWIDAGGSQSDFETLLEDIPPYNPGGDTPPRPAPLGEWDFGAAGLSPADIEPRGWLLGNLLCRQFVSSLLGDGAAGKTAMRIACALSLVTGRNLIGEHVFERCNVLFICFEDSETELTRRIFAAMLHYGITNEDVAGHLFVRGVNNSDLKLAANHNFETKIGLLGEVLDEVIVRRRIDAVFLDPFVKTHSVPENDNNAIDFVIGILTGIALRRNAAVDSPHHTRKGGAADPGNADAGRGGSAFKDGGRLVYTLGKMTPEDAKRFGVSEAERRLIIRMDSAKVNISPPDRDTRWFKLVGVDLGNVAVNPLYPRGDSVQSVEIWTPPDVNKIVTIRVANEILDAIEAGPAEGRRYSAHPRTNSDRALWPIVNGICGLTEGQTAELVADWVANSIVKYVEYHDQPTRNAKAQGLIVLCRPGAR